MSRQVSLMVKISSTMLGFLGWSNPNLLAQPSPNTSFEQTQTTLSPPRHSSEPLSGKMAETQRQKYRQTEKSSFNPRLEQLQAQATDNSSFSPVPSFPKIPPEDRVDSLEFSLTVDSLSEKDATNSLLDSCSTQNISEINSSSPQNSEAQKLLLTPNPCFAEPNLWSSDLGFSQSEEKLTVPEIFSPLSIAKENSAEPNPESDLDQPSSSSQEIDSEDQNSWQFKFQPFAPIPITTYGSATIRDRRVDYHLSLGKVLDLLRVTASGRFEAWYGDLGLIVAGYYGSLQGTGIREFTRFPNINLKETLRFDQGIYDFALSYHFGAHPQYSPTGQPSPNSFPLVWFEPMIGTRLNDINTTIDAELDFGRLGRIKQPRFERGRTWFEPLIGGKLGVQISEPVTLWVRGNASGFGVAGDDADLSWNVSFGADWRVNRNASLQLGYYFYQIDYQNGRGNNTFGFESNQNGPYLSATFHF